jgi:hypothetical protein
MSRIRIILDNSLDRSQMRNPLMAAALLMLLLVGVSPAPATWTVLGREIPYRERSEEETRLMFASWKARYRKSYSSVAEEERRYAIFKGVVRKVDQHDAAADAGLDVARLGLNGLTDRTTQEWNLRCGGERPM